MEAGLKRFQRSAGARHPAHIANIGNVVAVVVGIPRRVLTGARILPGNLIAARRLLRTDRRPGAKLTGHKIRAAKLQRGTGASAVIKEIMIGNLREVGRALRLDHRRDKPDLPVAIEILMKAGLKRFQRRAGARHLAHTADIGDVVAVVVGIPRRVLTGARVLPGDLIAARRLLRTDRRPGCQTDRPHNPCRQTSARDQSQCCHKENNDRQPA